MPIHELTIHFIINITPGMYRKSKALLVKQVRMDKVIQNGHCIFNLEDL